MWWLAIFAVLYFFRGKIAERLAPILPSFSPQQAAIYGHAATLATGAIFVLPIEFFGLGAVKRFCYMTCLWSNIFASGITLKANYGSPPMPEKISISALKSLANGPLQEYLMKVTPSADFMSLFFCLIFMPAYPSLPVVALLGRRSLWTVCGHCQKTGQGGRLFAMFKPRWEALKTQEQRVLLAGAVGEILLGFWLTVSIALPSRQLLTTFMYWNYLKMRYQSPRSNQLHSQAWKSVEATVAPVLRVAPFLQKPIDMAKGWFQPQYR